MFHNPYDILYNLEMDSEYIYHIIWIVYHIYIYTILYMDFHNDRFSHFIIVWGLSLPNLLGILVTFNNHLVIEL